MSEQYDQVAEVIDEARAVRHLFNLPTDEREPAAEQLDTAACHLVLLVQDMARAMKNTPNMQLVDVAAILQRTALREDVDKLKAAGASDLLDPATPVDPKIAAAAFAKAVEGSTRRAAMRQAEEAARVLAAVQSAPDATTARAILDKAAERLERPANTRYQSLAERWDVYRADRFGKGKAGPQDVLRLDPRRGAWASWVNAWMGARGGIEPGRCVLVGARPGAGKTSLAAAIGVDALHAGVPVLFWQMELSGEETLEHMFAQIPGSDRWWIEYWTKRCNRQLPDAWEEGLILPPCLEPEDYEAEMIVAEMRRLAKLSTRSGVTHKVRGLVIVDYVQLLSIQNRRAATPQHEVLCKAASMLAKTAADLGLGLVLLSQLTKEAKKDKSAGRQGMEETAASGADLSRSAHVFFGLDHAKNVNGSWVECGQRDVELGLNHEGEARLLVNIKRRGFSKIGGTMPPFTFPFWMSDERALHGGDSMDVHSPVGVAPSDKLELAL